MEWLIGFAREKKIPLMFQENLFRDGKYHGFRNRALGSLAFQEFVKNSIGPEDVIRF